MKSIERKFNVSKPNFLIETDSLIDLNVASCLIKKLDGAFWIL